MLCEPLFARCRIPAETMRSHWKSWNTPAVNTDDALDTYIYERRDEAAWASQFCPAMTFASARVGLGVGRMTPRS